MSAIVKGRLDWSKSVDAEGYRNYKLLLLVEADDAQDGPHTISQASGMPIVGTPWLFGNDNDFWAFCWPTASFTPILTKEPNRYWQAELNFSNKPMSRCQDNSIEDPLLEPPKISGSFTRWTKKAKRDRNGKMIKSSSHEPIDGLEVDANRPSIVIVQNLPTAGVEGFAEMVDTLNDAPLWGMDERKIKLSNVSFDQKIYGTCNFYYTRTLEFEVRREGFDFEDVLDVGWKVRRGKWEGTPLAWNPDDDADNTDPNDFIVFKDSKGENFPQRTPLDGQGDPLTDPLTPVYIPTVEYYPESNFALLGIPTSL